MIDRLLTFLQTTPNLNIIGKTNFIFSDSLIQSTTSTIVADQLQSHPIGYRVNDMPSEKDKAGYIGLGRSHL